MKIGGFHAPTPVHDPDIVVGKDDNYYIFGTHMTAAVSKDLRYWESLAQGVNAENPLFDNLFDDRMEAFSYCGKFEGRYYAVWAPDVSYNPYLQKYVMYFCTSGSYIKSCICMATADDITGPYHFERILMYSGFDRNTIAQTDVEQCVGSEHASGYLKKDGGYNNLSWPNCIDPNLFHDKEGRLWMVYGSWSGGIFLLEIDEHTGLPIHPERDSKNQVDPYFGRKLLGGGHKSIEGPFILYDEIADYYYLFVSFGWLAREGGYQIRLFRSKKPEGPYVDMEGKTFRRVNHHDPYGLKLMGNYMFPSMEYGYKSPGHNSAFQDQDGRIYMVYHQRFDVESEMHEPRVHQLFRTGNNWLTVCPFATDGEMLCRKDYQKSEVCGTFYVVEHGLDISNEMHQPLRVEFTRNGEIRRYRDQNRLPEQEKLDNLEKNIYGLYTLYEDSRIAFSLNGVNYEGVIVQLNDEAGNPTMCITGVGENQSAWAVRYI
jgi:arabinan endo-1,5-alpha-L-arabinosidase